MPCPSLGGRELLKQPRVRIDSCSNYSRQKIKKKQQCPRLALIVVGGNYCSKLKKATMQYVQTNGCNKCSHCCEHIRHHHLIMLRRCRRDEWPQPWPAQDRRSRRFSSLWRSRPRQSSFVLSSLCQQSPCGMCMIRSQRNLLR